mgnify:CR=1 FL=1
MTYVLVFLAGVNFGALIGAAATRYRIRQRQAARRDLAMQCRSPVDLEPTEFSYGWEWR